MAKKSKETTARTKIPSVPPPRERILTAACDLFYHKGLHAVGVDAIAAAADTNKMTLYRHFSSKDELIATYLRTIADEGDVLWEDLAQKYPDDPKKHLMEWLTCVITPEDRGCAFLNAAAELPDKNHPGRKVIEDYKKKGRERLIELCKSHNLLEPEGMADELFLLFEGFRASLQSIGPNGPATRFPNAVSIIIDAHTKKV